MHPAIVAQAAATASALLPGRFFLGVGSGENLNEHIVGQGWPETEVRQARLEEAIHVIRRLWTGDLISHHGPNYTVENARLYTLPDELPPLLVAVGGPESVALAGRVGDGLITTSPERDLIAGFEAAGGKGKSRYGGVTVCWGEDEAAARKTAHAIWPTAAMESSLSWELPLPKHFEDVATLVTEDSVATEIVCGPDPHRHAEAIMKYARAGFDHVSVHQVGPDQSGFFRFFSSQVMPKLEKAMVLTRKPRFARQEGKDGDHENSGSRRSRADSRRGRSSSHVARRARGQRAAKK
jgi:G6PDH family F420-dependent oxidoreductase